MKILLENNRNCLWRHRHDSELMIIFKKLTKNILREIRRKEAVKEKTKKVVNRWKIVMSEKNSGSFIDDLN